MSQMSLPSQSGPSQVWNLPDPPVATFVPVDSSGFRQSGPDSAIVIDNGSHSIRAGWSFEGAPRLVFPPQASRYRDRKLGRMITLVGTDVYYDGSSRSQARGVFDAGTDVVYSWDVMESVLDYVFLKMGIEPDRSGGIGRPVVMTEPLANPAYPRRAMSELLFECYNAPSVAFGIDSLFSFRHNGGRTGVVASSSYSSTHIIPVVDSRPVLEQATRLNWGRYQHIEYMLKLLRLKYPAFPGKLTDLQVDDIIREHCYVSSEYPKELDHFLDWDRLEKNDRTIQHPYVEPVVVQKTEEELAAAAAKRKESGRRLQEQAAKQRLEKLIKKEQDLEFFKELQAQVEAATTKRDVKRILESNNFETEPALDRAIKELERSIRRSQKKDIGEEEEDGDTEVQTFPLLEVPDDQLDEEGLKQKKQQRLQKAGYDARQRAKQEKAREAERLAEKERAETEQREKDLAGWAEKKRQDRADLIQRMKERDQTKTELGNRKSTATQMRMRTLNNLAFDAPAKKRRRGGDEDTFGADDADWDVYRSVRGANASDDEDDDDLDGLLAKVESALLTHDPSFTAENRHEAETDWSRSLLHAFYHGPSPFDPESIRDQNRLHVNVERIRVPEVLFQPTIAGVEQAGFSELIGTVICERFGAHPAQAALASDVFLTGGNTLLAGLRDRVERDLIGCLPVERRPRLRSARDPVLDAWRGAAGWAGSAEGRSGYVTRQEYLEKGADYLREHECGNVY